MRIAYGMREAVREKLRSLSHEKRALKIVAIDVEAFEGDPKQILEVGIATLRYRRTNTLGESVAGVTCSHFIVKENKSIVNGRFVPNCRHLYRHGRSEELPCGEIKSIVEYLLGTADLFVAHSLENEQTYLGYLGVASSLTREPHTTTVDTQILHRAASGNNDSIGLANLGESLGASK